MPFRIFNFFGEGPGSRQAIKAATDAMKESEAELERSVIQNMDTTGYSYDCGGHHQHVFIITIICT